MHRLYITLVRAGRLFFEVAHVPVPRFARRFHRILFSAVSRVDRRDLREEVSALASSLRQGEIRDYLERVRRDDVAPLWVVTCLPPDKSGVAIYTQHSLAAPAGPVTFFAPVRGVARLDEARRALALVRLGAQQDAAPAEIFSLASLVHARRAMPEQPVLFVLGNSEHHMGTLSQLLVHGATPRDAVHLHDIFLGDLLALYFGTERELRRALLDAYPAELVAEWFHERAIVPESTGGVNGPRLLLRKGVGHFVVNSAAAAERLRTDLGSDVEGVRIDTLFLPVLPAKVRVSRRDPERLRIGHFGVLHQSKQPDRLVAACDLLAVRRRIELILAGHGVRNYLRRHGLGRDYVRVIESPTDHELEEAMSGVDCAVQLRSPDHGESSGVVNQLLAMRQPVVCTRIGSFAELEGAVRLVGPEVSPSDLAAAIEQATTTGWSRAAEALVTQRSPSIFEARLRGLLDLGGATASHTGRQSEILRS